MTSGSALLLISNSLSNVARRTPATDELIATLRDRVKSKLVLGALDDRYLGEPVAGVRDTPDALGRESLAVQEEMLAAIGKPAGHLWLERKAGLFTPGNATVRFVGGPNPKATPGSGPSRESFSAVIAKAAGHPHEPASRLISWQRPPANGGAPQPWQ